MVVELIADRVHLSAGTVRAIFDLLGGGAIVLVTDALAAAGMPDGTYDLGPMRVRKLNGVARLADRDAIAGGTGHLIDVVRCTIEAGIPLEVGRRADVVVTDAGLTPLAVMRAGAWVFGDPGPDEATLTPDPALGPANRPAPRDAGPRACGFRPSAAATAATTGVGVADREALSARRAREVDRHIGQERGAHPVHHDVDPADVAHHVAFEHLVVEVELVAHARAAARLGPHPQPQTLSTVLIQHGADLAGRRIAQAHAAGGSPGGLAHHRSECVARPEKREPPGRSFPARSETRARDC